MTSVRTSHVGLVILVVLGLLGPGRAMAQPAAEPGEAAGVGGTAASAEASGGNGESAAPDPLRVELDSPRATMFTFLRAMGQLQLGRDDAAAVAVVRQTFDVSSQLPDEAVTSAAVALLEVLNKLGTVQEQHLPSAEEVAREDLGRFIYFPGRDDQQWVWEQLKEFNRWPTGQIVLSADEAGAWRFSRRTVTQAVELAESLSPLPPRHVAPLVEEEPNAYLSILGPTFEQTSMGGWLALLIAIFVGLAVGKLVSATLNRVGERWTRHGWRARGTALQNAASPASLALLTLGLAVGLHGFIYLDESMATFVNNILAFLYLLALGWLLYNLVDVVELGLKSITSRTASKLDDMILPLVRKSLRIFVVIVFALMVAQNVFGLNITGWLAGLGIAGLAVSLAAQDSVKNLFGSLTVFFDKPFVVGDFIDAMGTVGTVEQIGFRSTRIRTVPGNVVTIPNMKWIDNEVENISRRPAIRREMNVTIPYDTPLDKVDEAIDIVKQVLSDPQVVEEGRFDMEGNPPRVTFDKFNADSLNIKAYYWYQLAGDPDRGFFSWQEHCELVNLKLLRRFADAGIEFAFPTQTLYLAGHPARQLDVHVAQK